MRIAAAVGVAIAWMGPVAHPAPAPPSNPPVAVASGASTGPAYGSYDWPVHGPVLRAFQPPEGPYGSGHRGIDIAVPLGTPVRAPAEGVVAFAGPVAGGRFVSVDHPDGVRTTYSWLIAIDVSAGSPVARGQVLGRTGPGHPGVEPPHLHLGARFAGSYIDPLLLLRRTAVVGLIRLAPLEPPSGGGEVKG
jgi:murein DD-endopeptidase MepM/ murein hydrolase activator NlpD